MEREGDSGRIPPRERFGRASRLRTPAEFQRVRRSGKRRQGRFITLHFARNADPDMPSRAGFSVSKRVGDAVQRNLVKRRLREAVRRRLWNVAPGWDMILGARPEAATAAYEALRDEVDELLGQARLLKTPIASIDTNTNNSQRETTGEAPQE